MRNHMKLKPLEKAVLIDSQVTGDALHGNNYDAITSKIKNYFGNDSVKSILDVDFIFMHINRHNHWYAAVVIRPNLILKGDSGNSG